MKDGLCHSSNISAESISTEITHAGFILTMRDGVKITLVKAFLRRLSGQQLRFLNIKVFGAESAAMSHSTRPQDCRDAATG